MSLALYGLWVLAVTLGFARTVQLNQHAAARNPRDPTGCTCSRSSWR